ncbi:MAG: sigma 54-dependent Fis family transcriptional regulator [Myxococcaceae bacterium]|nr:sigma 54-dependent Fis family transcriptional regulator [Myxococcaceae bacterium]
MRSREYRLTVVSGPSKGRSAGLPAPLVLGSAEDAGFRLEDPTVSRYHAQLKPRSDGVWVKDLDSMNGISVGGARVQAALVENEATLTVGQSMVRISVFENDLGAPLGPETLGEAVAQSHAMRRVFGLLERLAHSDVPVVLLGETGTGKDVLAQALHRASARASRPFVVFDCSAVAANLIESELFGHAKGAFTGAAVDRRGAFQQADGGTLFLDEIGELPLELQPRLLRALESGQVKPLGDDTSRSVDVRIVAATHRDLEAATREGRFRQDLWYRLAVALVRVPPLRERIEDITLLARHFVKELKGELALSPELVSKLNAYAWPGNVRELRNVVARALLGEANVLEAPAGPQKPAVVLDLPFKEAKERLVDSFTRDYLEALLHRHGGNVARAARAAGLARPWLHKLAVKYGLKASEDDV